MLLIGLASVLLAASAVVVADPAQRRHSANAPPKPQIPKPEAPAGVPVTSRNGTELPPYDTWYHFQQLVDHSDPSQGTFDQRYYFTYMLPSFP